MTPLVAFVEAEVKALLAGEGTGHDWEHIRRVWLNALRLAEEEGADGEKVSLLALLHDVDDVKVSGVAGTDKTHPQARAILARAGVDAAVVGEICAALAVIGYRKALDGLRPATLEGQIVSDADFLEALGAIGMARTFAFGGNRGRALFLPESFPVEHADSTTYAANATPSLNHVFEKLLRLKGLIFTASGRAEAEKRHHRMIRYLEDFFEEVGAPPAWLELLAAYR